MLYLDYSRKEGEWIPNEFGGRENLAGDRLSCADSISDVYHDFPDVQTIAEESTAWPMVSRPVYVGGLGFGMKWDMGWMHDTLHYMSQDPIYRKYRPQRADFPACSMPIQKTSCSRFRTMKWCTERDRCGERCQATSGNGLPRLRLLFGYQWAQSGKKLLFMGGEFGHVGEWNHDAELDWSCWTIPLMRESRSGSPI